jgi:hypothetical protein
MVEGILITEAGLPSEEDVQCFFLFKVHTSTRLPLPLPHCMDEGAEHSWFQPFAQIYTNHKRLSQDLNLGLSGSRA